ncbi:MAG: arsenate reductase ArsC [Syntrophobacterales bacterium]|jgi:arsenate reductase
MTNKKKLRILYLCTGNSCRSQMAEAFTRHLKGDQIEALSAGVAPKGIDPRATKAMSELGIDMANQGSKSLNQVIHRQFDYVVTLCDNAQKTCPSFPGKTRVIHVGFDDPPKLAAKARDEEEAMLHYRRVRDEIKGFVEKLPESLSDKVGQQKDFQAGIQAFLDDLPLDLTERKED